MSVTPGWYDDPDGVAGCQRWWNGVTWSDVTRGGGTAVGGPLATAVAQRTSYDVLEGGPQERPDRPRRWLPWALVGGALLLIVVLAVTLAGGGSSGGATTADPSAGPGTAGPGTTDPGNPFPPGTVRILDPDAGISYAYLGEGWRELEFTSRPEMLTAHGQYIITQPTVPDGGQFIAECSSGLLARQFTVSGPQSFAGVIDPVSESFRANYYPGPNEKDVLTSEVVTIAGRPGYLLKFDLTWEVSGYDSTGERVALLLLDTGKQRPAVVYISVPNTHAELYGVIDQVIASIELL
ncbi:MAG: DUF2510 domain-containing protein [Geodermatophilaceae bacterium]|nr:DUF2510 domain-containing protein [Geodermatophilaceae bacterium]